MYDFLFFFMCNCVYIFVFVEGVYPCETGHFCKRAFVYIFSYFLGYVHMQYLEFWQRALVFIFALLYRVCTYVRLVIEAIRLCVYVCVVV